VAQFRVTSSQSGTAGRYVIADGRLLMQIVEFPPSSQKDLEPFLTPFFDSLEVTEAKSASTKKSTQGKN
jgi:hypothetical protein